MHQMILGKDPKYDSLHVLTDLGSIAEYMIYDMCLAILTSEVTFYDVCLTTLTSEVSFHDVHLAVVISKCHFTICC